MYTSITLKLPTYNNNIYPSAFVKDFAVGAPYDGLYGRGAVYIYHGSATGVRKESTQVSENKMNIAL